MPNPNVYLMHHLGKEIPQEKAKKKKADKAWNHEFQ